MNLGKFSDIGDKLIENADALGAGIALYEAYSVGELALDLKAWGSLHFPDIKASVARVTNGPRFAQILGGIILGLVMEESGVPTLDKVGKGTLNLSLGYMIGAIGEAVLYSATRGVTPAGASETFQNNPTIEMAYQY